MKKPRYTKIRFLVIGLIIPLLAIAFSAYSKSEFLDILIWGYAVFLTTYLVSVTIYISSTPLDDSRWAASKRSGGISASSILPAHGNGVHIRNLEYIPHSQPYFDDVEEYSDRLFDNWTQFDTASKSIRGHRAFLVAREDDPIASILKSNILEDGFDLDVCSDIDTVTESIINAPQTWSLLVIDWDMLRSDITVEDAIDVLFYFRRFINHIPMILASSEFSCDDFGTERMLLSDVSVRSAVSSGRFKVAIRAAFVNNEFWRQTQQGQLSATSKDLMVVGGAGNN